MHSPTLLLDTSCSSAAARTAEEFGAGGCRRHKHIQLVVRARSRQRIIMTIRSDKTYGAFPTSRSHSGSSGPDGHVSTEGVPSTLKMHPT